MTDRLLARLLDAIEHDIVPLTREGVRKGDKVFGAAVLKKSDLALVVAGTNAETENPLLHGEMATIKKLYEMPATKRPAPADCIFLSTHEPCSMCLSAITWAGYDNIYYLFGYERTRDTFDIPHDLRILEEVFACKAGAYVRKNAFWESHDIVGMTNTLPDIDRAVLAARIDALTRIYRELSDLYQTFKPGSNIPLP